MLQLTSTGTARHRDDSLSSILRKSRMFARTNKTTSPRLTVRQIDGHGYGGRNSDLSPAVKTTLASDLIIDVVARWGRIHS